MSDKPRILVSNDDGIDAVGLHVLARALRDLGEVIIVAPDDEYSGAGAAIGAIWERRPEIHEAMVEGIDTAWAVSGPPALCVMFARLGTFGDPPDLVVSGINPGANVGRAVYHSGTVGAAISARIGGIPAIAVSQSVSDYGVEGQAWGEVIAKLHYETAATIAAQAAEALLANPTPTPGVLNINVPDLELDLIEGWDWCEVATDPLRSLSKVTLHPKPGHTGSYSVEMEYGEVEGQRAGTDTRAIMDNRVSLSWLSRITADPVTSPAIDLALNGLLD